ncbi:ABC transporter substrate-binding protein [Marinomonas foliarum]|uniref:Iron(III) transport system substrate-binding protein n=1 Tax=Marinomonas foliarum TaxID=491950 RepID=A0A369AH92_9GAMM|nr:ABC transporter substrate-binding protein [Marinomonas foliarum]RCX08465.1 iron(III) transport system substrate-binding protein [Marinomonas foliarum]
MTVKKTLLLCAAALALPLSVQAQDVLTLYTSQPNKDAQMTVDAFEAANPDIKVEWVRDGTTKLMTKLRAELSSGVVKPDVLLIADSVTMESMVSDDYLYPYMSPNRDQYEDSLYSEDGYYYGTKLITTGIVRHKKASQHPTDWNDFVKPEYKNQVAMPSPLYSGAALIHLATLTDDESLSWNYYEQLHANQVMAQGGNGGVLKAVASGTKPYGVIVDFLAIREAAKGSPIEFIFPKTGVSMVTEPVAIMKEAKNKAAAKRFVDFLLSKKGQGLVLEQGYLPARSDIGVPEGFPKRADIRLMPFDAAKTLRDNEANKARFSKIFEG